MKLKFPLAGLFKGGKTDEQLPTTSPKLLNVRPADTLDNRLRGGQRPALDKWGAGTQIGAAEQPVVAMCSVATPEA